MKFLRSLTTKYMLIILTAILLVQITVMVGALVIYNIDYGQELTEKEEHFNPDSIENRWHKEASTLSIESVQKHFEKWKQQYPQASMFWVDRNGKLQNQLDVKEQLPLQWDATKTAEFIKNRYNNDPFTVIAFVGKEKSEGFIVFEIPRDQLIERSLHLDGPFALVAIGIVLLFIVMSFLFFRGIRKRLLSLQEAMEVREVDGLPVPIAVKKEDEIGSLEHSFNRMINELKESKQREQQEEQLRRELIANLSHDLRTPLTKIQAYSYSLAKETKLSEEGRQAAEAMNQSVKNVDGLIENLMSYTLLMASKLSYESKSVDIIRFTKTSVASWYPLFEKEGFEIDVHLEPFHESEWQIDPVWMERIFDNLFQNIMRHAKSGLYLGVRTESNDIYDTIVIADRGPGMATNSDEKGAGIGLSIVDRMMEEMKLEWDIVSNVTGTAIKIKRRKLRN